MGGIWTDQTWAADTTPGIPAKYRRACRYRAYLPDRLADLALELPLDLAGLVAEAETVIRALDQDARPALIPLARVLLKAESIASSKVEGLRLSVRELARAEARLDIGEGGVPGPRWRSSRTSRRWSRRFRRPRTPRSSRQPHCGQSTSA